MRIVFAVLDLAKGKGGAERVAAEVANEMVRRGHQVAIYSNAKESEVSSYPLAPQIRHIKILFVPANIPTIQGAVKDFRPDCAFIFYSTIKTLLIPYHLFETLGLPIGLQECTNPERAVQNFMLHKPFNGSLEAAKSARASFLAGAQRIRFTMPAYRDSAPPQAITNVRTFFNAFPRFQPVDQDSAGTKAIISVGSLKSKNKNGLVLLQAFASIAKEFSDWELRYYGNPGKDMMPTLALQTEHPQIKLCGSTNDIHSAYHNAHVHVICSFHEGCPNVVCEAMGHGLPSVGFSDCPGTNVLIRDGENGLLIERVNEVDSLAGALRRLMSNTGLRKKLGAAAYEDAVAFEASKIFDQWEMLLRDIADAPRMAEARAQVMAEFLATPAVEKPKGGAAPSGPLVSFVVPLFNKEQHIRETLHSIARCGYNNKEIIVVDDESTDESTKIVEIFARKAPDLSVRLVCHAENRGLSSARNTGLAEAKGKYVQFWDADDIYGDQLSGLVAEMEEDRSDIGTGVATRDGVVLDWYRPGAISRRATTFDQCQESFAASSTCFKLYRREFLEKNALRFVDGLYMQDTEFNLRAFPIASCITVTPRPIGEYKLFDDSASKQLSVSRLRSSLEIERLTREFYVANALHRFETFRQTKVIAFVFRYFIRRLLSLHLMKEQDDSWDARTVSDFLGHYGNALCGMQAGVRALASQDPLRALGCIALIANQHSWALKLLTNGRNGLPEPGFERVIASERAGFSAAEIQAIFAAGRRVKEAPPA